MNNRFVALLRKELRESSPAILLFTGALIALYTALCLWPRTGGAPRLHLFLAFSPLQFLPFWVLWRSLAVWRREDRGNHLLLLLSLPVPGWMIVAAKLSAILLETLLYLLIIAGGFYLTLFGLSILPPLSPAGHAHLLADLVYGAFLVGLVFAGTALLLQFAYLASRLTHSWRPLLFIAALLASFWAALRLGGWLSPLLQWLPHVPVPTINFSEDLVLRQWLYVQVAPLVGVLLVLGALFWISARWVERDLEA